MPRTTPQPWWKRIYPGVRFTPNQPTTLPHPHSLRAPPPTPWYSRIYPTSPLPHRDHFPPRPIARKLPTTTRIDTWTQSHVRPLRAIPNTLATVLWTTMLLYFASWYTTRKKVPTGPEAKLALPKPCHAFSLWPYISCVGQHEKLVFRGVCIAMALLISFSFIQLTRLTAPIKTGRRLRFTSTAFAILSSVALVALTYELIDEMPLPHLITASGQIFAMFVCKCFDWGWNMAVRRAWARKMGRWRRVRALEVSRWCKIGVAAFSVGPAIFTCLGIYGCQNADVIADQASTCNRIVALSEIAEWELSLGWVAYMCCIAYDLYHVDDVVRIWVSAGIDDDVVYEEAAKEDGMEGGNGVQVLLPLGMGRGDLEGP
ncbi:hypothetical protein CC86DRAFT_405929 [Ophiobolus disseminans]|uniref:CWH43-like N-terminal domain-containing protein n=1 Tax=Ophiobolus disseminans TaxID=1469910 RepID=A0A6A7A1J2_9PLEO|nr:hypothetical protein CC86DRAFT_405929 [Ophiobolus disseminans]